MTITLIENKKEIDRAIEILEKRFHAPNNQKIPNVKISYRTEKSEGGGSRGDVFWSSKMHLWWHWGYANKRYWNCFGTKKPCNGKIVEQFVEINIPFRGTDHKVAGAFAKKNEKTVLIHSGIIGGGRDGIGKTLFWKKYRGKSITIEIKGKKYKYAMIGEINSPRIKINIRKFVEKVQSIKNLV